MSRQNNWTLVLPYTLLRVLWPVFPILLLYLSYPCKYCCLVQGLGNVLTQLLESAFYCKPLIQFWFVFVALPNMHDKGRMIQPDYNGSFSYGALVSSDSTPENYTAATLAIVQEQHNSKAASTMPYWASDLKKD